MIICFLCVFCSNLICHAKRNCDAHHGPSFCRCYTLYSTDAFTLFFSYSNSSKYYQVLYVTLCNYKKNSIYSNNNTEWTLRKANGSIDTTKRLTSRRLGHIEIFFKKCFTTDFLLVSQNPSLPFLTSSTTLFHITFFKSQATSSFVFQIINNKSDLEFFLYRV